MHKYNVQTAEQITPSTLLLTLQKDEASPPFAFQPGQYAAIAYYRKHRPSVVRCFSIVSSPTEQNILQFGMRTKGHYTKSLTRLKKGDTVTIRGPYGGFVFNEARDKQAVLIAGGIGITPFMSMIKYAAATNSADKIDLVYSCQNQDDVPFGDLLKELQYKNSHFKTTFVFGSGPTDKFAGYQTAQGRISPEILDTVTNSSYHNTSTTFFVCGPPPFMKAMIALLRTKGVSEDQIMTEAFSQGPNKQTGKIRSWPFNMYALTAAGVGIGSFVVMMSDLFKTLPPSAILGSTKTAVANNLSNNRQKDLDDLVNQLPSEDEEDLESDQVKAANQAANTPQTTTAPAPTSTQTKKKTSSTPTLSPTASSTSSSSSTSTTPTLAPQPAPAPPKCTTTQSGVTVC